MATKIVTTGAWGYSMTLNSFFVVVKETAKTAIVREIGAKSIENSGYLAGYEVPDKDAQNVNFKEYRVLKTADGYKGKVGLYRTFKLKEVKEGDKFYYNHCD